MYKIDKNSGGSRYVNKTLGLSTKESNDIRSIGAPNYEFYELEACEVIDIILSSDHPDFESYEDIGKAKIRFVVSENGKGEALLSYAKPMNSNIKDYPLIGEVVVGVMYVDELFYTQRLNIFNNPNQNASHGISVPSLIPKYTTKRSAEEYESISTSGNANKRRRDAGFKLGSTFLKNDNIKPIQLQEGDVVIEGRFGESINLSSNSETGNPTLKIRVGQPDDVPDTLLQPVNENFNNDRNSIWITTDNTIPLIPSTNESRTHLQFYDNKPKEFLGNQIFMNSDRIVLNTKENEFMTFAKRAINLVTEGIFTVDAETDIILNTPTKTVVNSSRIYLGNNNATEPLVLGDTWEQLMGELIDAIVALTVPTSVGPSGPPLNSSQFNLIKQKLQSALSKQNYSL